jgi:CRISPR-associated protein Csx17
MPDVVLTGCTPEPLMSYLKALGIFRLVAEQADQEAKLSWQGGYALLRSKLGREDLEKFFLEQYQPTPVTAPWNGGSGFYGGGCEPLDAIANSKSPRLGRYRDTINRIRAFPLTGKPKDEQKQALLVRCRSELGDDVVPWLDVCFVLGEEGANYFPLLGTGGNDGRLEFTNNFMQRIANVLSFGADTSPPESSREWLAAALFADTLVGLGKTAIGQFNPGGIGGANGSQGKFEADSRVNPWDFVLMIEGALLFAGSVSRRLGSNASARAVFPFSVESIAIGYGSAIANEETNDGSRAELWLPMWPASASLAEVSQLFAEGRAQFGKRQARNAVEFALAVNLMGVSRGVTSFARFGFLRRNGLSFLAAPLGRIPVTMHPQARLLEDPPLIEWIDRLRSACRDKERTPSRYQMALRQIDQAYFDFANRSEQGNDAKYLVAVLRALGRAEQVLANGLAFAQEKYIRPLQRLNEQWLSQSDDASREFRLAASLAGVVGRAKLGSIRTFLEEVEVTKFVSWAPGSTSATWSKRPLTSNLAAIFRRRQMEAYQNGEVGTPLDSYRPAPLDDVIAFLHDEIDQAKLADLIWGLSAINWAEVDFQVPDTNDSMVPFEFGVPRLLVEPRNITAFRDRWIVTDSGEPNANPDPDVFHILASGQKNAVEQCVDRAARRLKSGGRLVHGYRNRRLAGRPLGVVSAIPADRLLAAMLFPLSNPDLNIVANAVLFPPDSEE